MRKESRKLAEEQVFSPERDEMDRRINQLAAHMGVRYWKFKSNSPSVTDDQSLVGLLSNAEKTGGLTPNLSREVLGDILNRDLPLYKVTEEFDPELPMSINLMRLSSQAGGTVGGNLEDGVLAPNQGQVPRGPDLNEDKKPDNLPELAKGKDIVSALEKLKTEINKRITSNNGSDT